MKPPAQRVWLCASPKPQGCRGTKVFARRISALPTPSFLLAPSSTVASFGSSKLELGNKCLGARGKKLEQLNGVEPNGEQPSLWRWKSTAQRENWNLDSQGSHKCWCWLRIRNGICWGYEQPMDVDTKQSS